jgi:hypothetical protein
LEALSQIRIARVKLSQLEGGDSTINYPKHNICPLPEKIKISEMTRIELAKFSELTN